MTLKQATKYGLLLIAAALVYTLLIYPALPERIPIHWNIRGEVDGWADKCWAVWLMPGTMAMLVGMLVGLPVLSPKEYSTASFSGTFNYIMICCTALMGYIHVFMLEAALHPDWNTGRGLVAGIFVFFALVGNVLGRVRRNFWMGVRTPWTLANDQVWKATHRLAGRLMLGAGLLGAIAVLVGVPMMLCFFLIIAAALIPVVYSYVYYRRL